LLREIGSVSYFRWIGRIANSVLAVEGGGRGECAGTLGPVSRDMSEVPIADENRIAVAEALGDPIQ
jgi:hypothetical protein